MQRGKSSAAKNHYASRSDLLALRGELLEEQPELGDGLDEPLRHEDEPVVEPLLDGAPLDLFSSGLFRTAFLQTSFSALLF